MLRRLSLVSVSALLMLLSACQEQVVAVQEVPPQPVRTLQVTPWQASETVYGTGLIEGKNELNLAFKIGGIIQQISVEAGQQVKKGQELATLDPVEIESEVKRAEEQSDKAKRDLERATQLNRKGLISTQEVQNAQTLYAMARAAVDAARFNREHARIVAPSDGVILRKLAEGRETIGAGMPVLSFGRADSGWVLRIGLADRQAIKVRRGDSVDISLDALGDRLLQGQVKRLGAVSDPRTGTVEVEIAVSAPGVNLVSGWIARARIQTLADTEVPPLVVPVGAVLEAEGDKAHVFRLAANTDKAERVNVRLGQLRGAVVEVLEGLQAGDTIISEGAAWLHDGTRVRVLPAPATH